MLSRVAEHFYWFGRHVERGENIARLILAYAEVVLDLPKRSKLDWYSLIEITGSQAIYLERNLRHTEAAVIRFLIDDPDHPGSIRSSVNSARENMRTTRDRVPREVAESMNELRHYVDQHGADSVRRTAARHSYLRGVIDRSQTLRGYMGGSLSHDAAYQFIRIGRMLERADMTTRIMDVRVDDLLADDETELLPAFDALQWMSVLRSLSAYQMYRREVRGRVHAMDVIDFLFLNPHFPRSVLHALTAARNCALQLPRQYQVLPEFDQLIQQVEELKTKTLARNSGALRKTIDHIQADINEIHQSFSRTYFGPEQDQTQSQ